MKKDHKSVLFTLGEICKLVDYRYQLEHGKGSDVWLGPPCLMTDEGVDLLRRLLDLNDQTRITAAAATASHSFLKQ